MAGPFGARIALGRTVCGCRKTFWSRVCFAFSFEDSPTSTSLPSSPKTTSTLSSVTSPSRDSFTSFVLDVFKVSTSVLPVFLILQDSILALTSSLRDDVVTGSSATFTPEGILTILRLTNSKIVNALIKLCEDASAVVIMALVLLS